MKFNYKEIHIGTMIKQLVLEKEINEDRIANFLKADTVVIDRMYEKKSLDTDLLLSWSKLLKYDLFRLYSQHLLYYSPTNNKMSSPSKKSEVPMFRKNIYTKEIIDFILELIKTKTKTTTEITQLYGIPKTTLHNWIKKYNI